jgi:hypothetical protein
MTNYQLGKIYKIVCNTTGLTYYGSTCEPTLARRLAGHVGKFNSYKNGTLKTKLSNYEIIEKNDYTIVLVELFPSEDKMGLQKRERYSIENNDCVNKCIPTRTEAEWRLENSDYGVNYRINNKEKISNYELVNRVHILEKKIEYYNKNRDKMLKDREEYYLKNKEKLLQYQIDYVKKNRDKRNAYKSEYYLKNKEKLSKDRKSERLKQKELKANQPLGETIEG